MTKRTALAGGVVGGLAVVEFTSGVIQGYYTPLFSDIARKLAIHDADINWLEAVQLLLSAIVVPLLARLGDMYGHRRVLLGTLILTGASAWIFSFSAWTFTGAAPATVRVPPSRFQVTTLLWLMPPTRR